MSVCLCCVFVLLTQAKWFSFLHLWHCCPLAGQSSMRPCTCLHAPYSLHFTPLPFPPQAILRSCRLFSDSFVCLSAALSRLCWRQFHPELSCYRPLYLVALALSQLVKTVIFPMGLFMEFIMCGNGVCLWCYINSKTVVICRQYFSFLRCRNPCVDHGPSCQSRVPGSYISPPRY